MNRTTTLKSALIEYLAREFVNLPEEVVSEKANQIIQLMVDELVANGRIEIRGFGSFSVRSQPARIAHNPRTGEKVETSAKRRPHFKPGKDLRNWVNAGEIPPSEKE